MGWDGQYVPNRFGKFYTLWQISGLIGDCWGIHNEPPISPPNFEIYGKNRNKIGAAKGYFPGFSFTCQFHAF